MAWEQHYWPYKVGAQSGVSRAQIGIRTSQGAEILGQSQQRERTHGKGLFLLNKSIMPDTAGLHYLRILSSTPKTGIMLLILQQVICGSERLS